MEQEQIERESFTKVAKELVNPNLLMHKDKGVKALTAACLVDILRLCAPDAPFTGQQLKVRSSHRQPKRCLANSFAGHLQFSHPPDIASFGRSFTCLPQPAYLRSRFSGGSEEHSLTG